uniref:Uncharacterized protein n=1 Tax=Nothoprocta perdicaria TaxID=30464 RepID=A0A8C6ZM91_NOTPE
MGCKTHCALLWPLPGREEQRKSLRRTSKMRPAEWEMAGPEKTAEQLRSCTVSVLSPCFPCPLFLLLSVPSYLIPVHCPLGPRLSHRPAVLCLIPGLV